MSVAVEAFTVGGLRTILESQNEDSPYTPEIRITDGIAGEGIILTRVDEWGDVQHIDVPDRDLEAMAAILLLHIELRKGKAQAEQLKREQEAQAEAWCDECNTFHHSIDLPDDQGLPPAGSSFSEDWAYRNQSVTGGVVGGIPHGEAA